MLKRIDHIGVVVDELAAAKGFLSDLGLDFDHDSELPGRLKAAFYRCGETMIEVIEISEPNERRRRLGTDAARVEHIAFEVDNLGQTMREIGRAHV